MKTSTTLTARYERRNARRRKVHLLNAQDSRAACGANSTRIPLTSNRDGVTCATCRVLLAKGAL